MPVEVDRGIDVARGPAEVDDGIAEFLLAQESVVVLIEDADVRDGVKEFLRHLEAFFQVLLSGLNRDCLRDSQDGSEGEGFAAHRFSFWLIIFA